MLTIKTISALINLYEAWHEADSETGYDAKAAEGGGKVRETVGGEELSTVPGSPRTRLFLF